MMNLTINRLLHFTLIVGVMMLGAIPGRAVDRHVVQNAPAPGNGYTNWNCAAGSIQEAIDAAQNGDTVWVGPGTYGMPPTPVVTDKVTNIVSIAKWITVRSVSDNPADTIIDAGGDPSNRCVRIYTQLNAGADSTARLSGFTLTNGNAKGGGVFFDTGNWTARTGMVENCIIEGDHNETDAGVYVYNVSATSQNLIVSNCTIRNHAVYGFWARTFADVQVLNCKFINNSPSGMSRMSGTTLIEGCLFDGNKKIEGNFGGALDLSYGSPTIRNCLFIRNHIKSGVSGASGFGGAAIGVNYARATIQNCTIISNTAAGSITTSAGLYAHGSGRGTNHVENSIVYGNYRDATLANYVASGPTAFTNTCTSPITDYQNAGNLDTEPKFVDPSTDDFRLSKNSPCLNAGTNQTWMVGAKDKDGNRRLDRLYGIVDMGCYEYVYEIGTTIIVK